MRRSFSAVGLAAAVVLLAAPPAAAEPYLTAEDAAELVEILAEATDRQDVCYGWAVDVSDESGGPSGLDAGSGRGVGNLASADGCRRWVELRGQVWWTAQTSDRDDDSVFEVVADGLRDPPTAADLAELGIPGNALVRDDGDVALYEAMLALPRIVADRGEAPSLELEPAASTPPAGSVPTGQPVLPDWLRQRWPVLGSGILLLLLAAALTVAFRRSGAAARRPAEASDLPAAPEVAAPAEPRQPDPDIRMHRPTGPPAAPDRPDPAPDAVGEHAPGHRDPAPDAVGEPAPDRPDADRKPAPDRPLTDREPAPDHPGPAPDAVGEPAPDHPDTDREHAPGHPGPAPDAVGEHAPDRPDTHREPTPDRPDTHREPTPGHPGPAPDAVGEPAPDHPDTDREHAPDRPDTDRQPEPDRPDTDRQPEPDRPLTDREPAPDRPDTDRGAS